MECGKITLYRCLIAHLDRERLILHHVLEQDGRHVRGIAPWLAAEPSVVYRPHFRNFSLVQDQWNQPDSPNARYSIPMVVLRRERARTPRA